MNRASHFVGFAAHEPFPRWSFNGSRSSRSSNRRWEAASNAALAVPFLLLTAFAVGVIVVHVRLRTAEKPPAVDVTSLSPSDIEVLRKVRQRALRTLRHRNVLAYKDFNGYDNAPFDTMPGGGPFDDDGGRACCPRPPSSIPTNEC